MGRAWGLLLPLAASVVLGCAPRTVLVAPPASAPEWVRAPLPDTARTVTLFYATDRLPSGRFEPRRFYGSTWGELGFGTCTVAVPKRRYGVLAGLGRWFRSAGAPVRGVRITRLEPFGGDRFLAETRAAVESSREHRLVLLVHGFNTPFERAARLAGQIVRDVGLEGPVVLYSWPAPHGYPTSEENVALTIVHLTPLLERLTAELGAQRVDVVGFSMGARAVAGSLERLDERGASVRIGQLVLIAADVDSRWFTQVAPSLVRSASRVTIYASSSDKAMRASRAFHGHPRVGGGGKSRVVGQGLDTIDVSRARAEMTGHGYIDELARDLRAVLIGRRGPERRPWLEPVDDARGTWWRLVRRP